MPQVPLVLDLSSNPGRYGGDGGGRLLNCFPEKAGDAAKTPFPFYPIEGLASYATLTGGARTRGAIAFEPYGYVVSGPLLFKVAAGGVYTVVGGIPGGDPVFMARNRKPPNAQIAIVSQGLRYIVEADVINTIADTDLGQANSVTSIGGYFVFTLPNGRFQISSIDEGADYDSLDIATAEANPDGLLVAEARAQEVIFFGNKSIEFWQHTGAAAFPFERNNGATLQNLGLLCPYSVRDLNDVKFFIASDGTVRQLSGYSPERVSTHSVERDIDTAAKTAITSTAYSLRGHQFYIIQSPDWSWCYDALTGLWHERQSYQENRWRGEVFVDVNGERVVGDFESGLLHRIDPDVYTEAGTHLVWTIRSAPMHAFPNCVGINALFVDTIPGTGLNTTAPHNQNPLLMLRWSDDGGKTFTGDRTAETGAQGQYSKRVSFWGLGQSGEDGRIFELSMSAAVVRGITGSVVDVDPLET